ncbi:hypothetical protein AB205_0010780 [Aquarana catesbeiana]|uniref:Uncharacterized protein n=1 Tax=Aquarana catesbeiana TaxID=8400 RepID=A0A2G9S6V7_AQUCT|nr:hypothetical protein AB205_0010780 [Aquarana catesbeiana]
MVPFKLVMYMCHLEMVEAVITQVKPIINENISSQCTRSQSLVASGSIPQVASELIYILVLPT